MFGDEAAALESAVATYDAYLSIRTLVESEGGSGVERLAPVTSEAVLAAETDVAESVWLPLGLTSTGVVTADSHALIRLDDRPRADGSVMVVSVCEDSSARTLALADGSTVTRNSGVRGAFRVTIGVDPAAGESEPALRVLTRDAADDPAACGDVAPHVFELPSAD